MQTHDVLLRQILEKTEELTALLEREKAEGISDVERVRADTAQVILLSYETWLRHALRES
jgi:hypothetical protein